MTIRTKNYGTVPVVEPVMYMLLPTIDVVEMDNGDIYEIRDSVIHGRVAVKTEVVSDRFIEHICGSQERW